MDKVAQAETDSFDPIGLELAFQPPPEGEDAEGALEALPSELLDNPFAEALDWEDEAEDFASEAGSPHSFKGCTASEKSILIDAADRSLRSVRHAASFVGSAYGRPDRMSADTRRLLLEHFHTVKRDHLRFILTRLMRIAKAIDEGIRFKAERSCRATSAGMECGYAINSMWFGGSGDVHICFDKKPGHCDFATASAPRQERILIHEVAHRYVGINDKAYNHLPAYKTLKPSQALDNADSYAFFAVDAKATLSETSEPAAELYELDGENEGLDPAVGEHDLDEALAGEDLTDEEGGSLSPQQVAFRDRVLAAHIASKRRKPFADIDPGQLRTIPGTDVKTLAATAEAAGRLLAAANAALRDAKARGDADALRTRRITISSGYRSLAHQRRRWMELFPKYYRLSQAARERLPGGAHSDAAVAYMLRPRRAGGFGLAGNIGAPGYSNHQSGIAVDFFQHRTPGNRVANSTAPAARAKWRATWFYRWIKENGPRFGFKQLETEEWHWEYQGQVERRQLGQTGVTGMPAKAPSGGELWTYGSAVTGTPVALFLPPAALSHDRLSMLLYVHGLLGPCPKLPSVPDGFISGKQFALGRLVSESGLPMAVVVPLLQARDDRSWQPKGLEKPRQLNAFVDEVLTEINRRLARSRQLSDLVIVGHSRGYGVIYPLVRSQDPARSEGALARLKGLWLLDATYGTVPLREFEAFASQHNGPEVRILYRRGSPTDKFRGRKSAGRVRLVPVPPAISHCALPSKLLNSLLIEFSGAGGTMRREHMDGREEGWVSYPSTATEWTEAGLAPELFDGAALDEDFLRLSDERFEPEEEDSEARYETLQGDQLDWLDYESDAGEFDQFDEFAEAAEEEEEEEEEEEHWVREPDEVSESWEAESFGYSEGEEPFEVLPEQFDALNQLLEHEAGPGSGLADRLKDAAAFLLGSTLRPGASGAGVSALQRALRSLGYSVTVDGAFGPRTDGAVRQFQSRSGLGADGVVGPQTKAAIAAALGGRPSPSPMPTPPQPVPPSPVPPQPDDGESVEAFADRLSRDWSRLSNGQVDAETKRAALITDYQRTLDGARRRYGTKYPEQTIRRAWKIGRQNEMLFKTDQSPEVKPLGAFAPPATRVQLVSDPAIPGSKGAPVAPATVRFAEELKRRFAKVSVTTYPRHGSKGFVDRGYSVDLFIPGRDERGFYRRADAIALIRAVDGAAKAIGAEWRIIYNDFAVASAINKEFRRRHVIFVGEAQSNKQGAMTLNWHGPDPLILHFHLDLAVREGSAGEYENVVWEEPEARYEEPETFNQLSAFENLFDSEAGPGSSLVDRLKGVAEFLIGPPLRRGSSGPAVAALQRALGRLGFDLASDGTFGPNTERSVREFQGRSGLDADGVVGPATKAALAAVLGKGGAPLPVPPPKPAPAPAPVGGKRLTPAQFAAMFLPSARKSEAVYRVPALVTLGQAALESGWGERAPRFNFFGIKARATDPEDTRQLLRTKEVLSHPNAKFPEVISVTPRADGRYDYVVRDWFRAYPSAEAAFDSHGRLLSAKKTYAGAFAFVHDPYAFAAEIARAGYATGPTYTQVLHSVMRLIEKTGLV
jgi:peptidoglycan hydrolase-like protein with peptidoglycan-binding domain